LDVTTKLDGRKFQLGLEGALLPRRKNLKIEKEIRNDSELYNVFDINMLLIYDSETTLHLTCKRSF